MRLTSPGSLPPTAIPFLSADDLDGVSQGRIDGIWWRASGSGPPLVLIQGLGYPAVMFHRLVPLLEPHHRVIVFDQRGIGNSADAPGLNSITLGSMAGDVASVVREVAGGDADVMGVSLGGIVAQELALAYPNLVRRLILAGTHTADHRVVMAASEVIQMMQKRPTLSDEEALRASVPFVYAPATAATLIEEDLAVRRAMHGDWAGYRAQMRAAVQYGGSSSRLPRIQAPTLVMHGELDQLVPVGNGTVIHERISGSRLRILEGLSHNFYSEDAELTASEITAFLLPRGNA